jgi:hypothetical protein
VADWRREKDGWSAPLAARPAKLLLDGKEWPLGAYEYDAAPGRLICRGMDPRLHVIENVIRDRALDLTGMKNVKVTGVIARDTLRD